MKKLISLFGLVVLSFTAQAAEPPKVVIDGSQLTHALSRVNPADLINWKVGDEAHYDVTVGQFGKLGKMDKSVTKDEGAALWIRQYLDIQVQKDTSELLINKADAKILKFIHNGKEEAIPDDKLEIISEETTQVTVPAGTFQCIHVTAKSEKVEKLEIWANPRDTVMDGALKESMSSQIGDIVLELTSFKRSN